MYTRLQASKDLWLYHIYLFGNRWHKTDIIVDMNRTGTVGIMYHRSSLGDIAARTAASVEVIEAVAVAAAAGMGQQ